MQEGSVDPTFPPGGFSNVQQRVIGTNVRDAASLEHAVERFSDPQGFERTAARDLVENLTAASVEEVGADEHLSLDGKGVRALSEMLRGHPAYGSGLPDTVVDLGGDGPEAEQLRGTVADLIVAGALATAGMRSPGQEDFDIVFHLAAGADAFSGLLRDVLGSDDLTPEDLFDRFRPPELTDLKQDLDRRTCMIGLQDALNDWGLAAMGSRGDAWSKGIDDISPHTGCAGTHVTITGAGFGPNQPSDVTVTFPRLGGGCTSATVLSWSDTRIVVVAPPNVGRGCVGFVRSAPDQSGNLVAAASQVAGELDRCLGKAGFGAARRFEKLGARPYAPCPPCLEHGENRFDGGAPEIRWFRGNGSDDVTLGRDDHLLLEWMVVGATSVAIVPVQSGASGNQLPMVQGPLNPVAATYDISIPATYTWDGEYELRASNGCSGNTPATKRIKVHMRARHALAVTGIETTQATQFFAANIHMLNSTARSPDNSVPLVAGKPTLARAFVASGVDSLFDFGLLPGVRARLHGFDATGKLLPGSPLDPLDPTGKPSTLVRVIAESSNSSFSPLVEARLFPSQRSFSFLLPSSWVTGGSIQVRVDAFPPAGVLPPTFASTSLTRTIDFRSKGLPLRIALLPVAYADPTLGVTTPAPNSFQQSAELDQIQRVSPSNRALLNVVNAPGSNPWTYGGNFGRAGGIGCGYGFNDINAELAFRAFFTLGFEDRVFVALLDGPAIVATGATMPTTAGGSFIAGCGSPMRSLGIAYLAGGALATILLGPLGAVVLGRLGTCCLGCASALIAAPPVTPAGARSVTTVGTLAQEIGHGFGLFHISGSGAAPPFENGWPNYENGADNDPSTPFQSIGEFGTEIDDFLGLPPNIRSYAPILVFPAGVKVDPHTDYMAYSSASDWTSPFIYLRMMAGTTNPGSPAPAGPMAGRSAPAHFEGEDGHDAHEHHGAITSIEELEKLEPVEPFDVALVRGTITEDGAQLDTVYVQRRGLRLVELEETPYRAELVDGRGEVLAGNGIVPLVDWHEPIRPSFAFALALPWSEEVARVVVSREGKELASIDVAKEPPKLAPPRVELSEQRLEVSFEAEHEQREALRYLVRFAADDERRWQLVAADLAENRCEVSLDSLPSGKECRIQVGASVGGRTIWMESEPFPVEPSPPELLLLTPQEGGASYSVEDGVCLRAEGFSVEDGTLPDEALRWQSDLDGDLGTGRLLMVQLTPGRHVVTVIGTSTAGAEAAANVAVTVT